MTLYISVFYYKYNEIRMRKIKLNLYYAIQNFNTSSLIFHINNYLVKYIINVL